MASLVGCAGAGQVTDRPLPPAPVGLTQLVPTEVLPRSLLILKGNNFVDTASHTLQLSAEGRAGPVEVKLGIKPTSVDRAEASTDDAFWTSVGEGAFHGLATVVSRSQGGETIGESLQVSLQLKRHLTPRVTAVGSGIVHLNSRVPVEGDGFLLGGTEGQTLVELKGCFVSAGASGPCETAGRPVAARMPLRPSADGDRRHATFELSPAIAGPHPGTLQVALVLVNMHPDGKQAASGSQNASFQLQQTRIEKLQPTAVSFGQYLEIRGAGFVGTPGSTLVRFNGTYAPKGGATQTVSFEMVPAYQDGTVLRDVLEEGQGLGKVVDLRHGWGTLDGTWKPIVLWNGEEVEGVGAPLKLQLAPIKQVVWMRFGQSWNDGLRLYGLNAADPAIRRRVLEVMRRDYAGVNVELREDEPTDFKLYAKVDVSGRDPNGLGLLGYDNTPGKDVGNQRLYDWLGGVNALTQQDGYPGYGGVFLESMLGFSKHPPAGVQKSPLANELFDQLFDPFRPDRGTPLTTAETLDAPEVTADDCPAATRPEQVACAIRALGSVVGSTASHEFGHSLGLANPYGGPTDYHDPGDQPNRLMDSGGDRPFEERAELQGQGPAVFCDEEYDYLKKILPISPAKDPKVARPTCY